MAQIWRFWQNSKGSGRGGFKTVKFSHFAPIAQMWRFWENSRVQAGGKSKQNIMSKTKKHWYDRLIKFYVLRLWPNSTDIFIHFLRITKFGAFERWTVRFSVVCKNMTIRPHFEFRDFCDLTLFHLWNNEIRPNDPWNIIICPDIWGTACETATCRIWSSRHLCHHVQF